MRAHIPSLGVPPPTKKAFVGPVQGRRRCQPLCEKWCVSLGKAYAGHVGGFFRIDILIKWGKIK